MPHPDVTDAAWSPGSRMPSEAWSSHPRVDCSRSGISRSKMRVIQRFSQLHRAPDRRQLSRAPTAHRGVEETRRGSDEPENVGRNQALGCRHPSGHSSLGHVLLWPREEATVRAEVRIPQSRSRVHSPNPDPRPRDNREVQARTSVAPPRLERGSDGCDACRGCEHRLGPRRLRVTAKDDISAASHLIRTSSGSPGHRRPIPVAPTSSLGSTNASRRDIPGSKFTANEAAQ